MMLSTVAVFGKYHEHLLYLKTSVCPPKVWVMNLIIAQKVYGLLGFTELCVFGPLLVFRSFMRPKIVLVREDDGFYQWWVMWKLNVHNGRVHIQDSRSSLRRGLQIMPGATLKASHIVIQVHNFFPMLLLIWKSQRRLLHNAGIPPSMCSCVKVWFLLSSLYLMEWW